MIDPKLIEAEARQLHDRELSPGRAVELAREVEGLLSAARALRSGLSFDDSFTDYRGALVRTASLRRNVGE